MFSAFNWQQMTSAFIVLFAVIDIIGSIPIIINLKEKRERCKCAESYINIVCLADWFLFMRVI